MTDDIQDDNLPDVAFAYERRLKMLGSEEELVFRVPMRFVRGKTEEKIQTARIVQAPFDLTDADFQSPNAFLMNLAEQLNDDDLRARAERGEGAYVVSHTPGEGIQIRLTGEMKEVKINAIIDAGDGEGAVWPDNCPKCGVQMSEMRKIPVCVNCDAVHIEWLRTKPLVR